MSNGFTIIEALCAFAVLSLVLVALYAVGGTTSRTLAVSMTHERAALLAQSKLDEIATSHAPLPAVSEGQFEGSNAHWHLDAHDVPGDANTRFRLQAVRLTLSWPAAVGSDDIAVETRLFVVSQP